MSDEDGPREELPTQHTTKEAADTLTVLEEFCFDAPCNTLSVEGLAHVRKGALTAQLSTKKQTTITDFFMK